MVDLTNINFSITIGCWKSIYFTLNPMKNPDVLLMISPCAIFHGYIPLYPAIFYLYIRLFSSFFLVKFTFIDTSHLTRPSRHPSLSEADSPSARAHRCLAALVVADWGSSASMLISIDVPKRPDLGLHISFNIPPIFRYPNPYIYMDIYIYMAPVSLHRVPRPFRGLGRNQRIADGPQHQSHRWRWCREHSSWPDLGPRDQLSRWFISWNLCPRSVLICVYKINTHH